MRPSVFRLISTAIGKRIDSQRTEKNRMATVIVQALNIRFFRVRYVFRQTTSAGAGAGLAINRMGSGSRIACVAIWHAAIESRVINASDVG